MSSPTAVTTVTPSVTATTKKRSNIRVFTIVAIIIAILFIIVFGVNAYYWNQIRNSTSATPVSQTTANSMFWVNIIWLVIGFVLLIWAFADLFIPTKKKHVVAAPATATVATAGSVFAPSKTTTPLYGVTRGGPVVNPFATAS